MSTRSNTHLIAEGLYWYTPAYSHPYHQPVFQAKLCTTWSQNGSHNISFKETSSKPRMTYFQSMTNLHYVSKLMERVAAKRLLNHMCINALYELLQSSYRKFHATEPALLPVQSDILTTLHINKKCALLVMLDLSTAFDMIAHSVLLSRLKSTIGITGKAVDSFTSYLTSRMQSIWINGSKFRLW